VSLLKRLRKILSSMPAAAGAASPEGRVFSDVSEVPLADAWELYKRDPACRSNVDLLAASTVGAGFYTTCADKAVYADVERAKAAVDAYCKRVNLDRMLNRMARRLIACGNDFWLKVGGELVPLPVDAVEKIDVAFIDEGGVRVPVRVAGYRLAARYGGGLLRPDVVIHWRFEDDVPFGFGVGLLQTLLYTLRVHGDQRPAYAWMKAKIERLMPKIFEKYAGPDVLAWVPYADNATIKKFESIIRNRSEEGNWLFYGDVKGKGLPPQVLPVQIDPRARFEYYIDHIINQFYLGCETPLARLFSTPGFTEASARAAVELQDMLVRAVQRDVKRTVEAEIFDWVVASAGFDAGKAAVRLNWGTPETPEVNVVDMLKAAELGLISVEEFRRNAVKFGWELGASLPSKAEEKRVKAGWLLQKLE